MNASLWNFCALLVIAGSASGQLARVANSTLNLPASLPSATGYGTENALGSLTFANPMVVASIAGETNRLFVAERGGVLKIVTNLSTTPVSATYLNLTSLLASGEALNTEGEDGFLSVTFHPDFAVNRTLFVYYTITASEGGATKYFQRLHRIVLDSSSSNAPGIASHEALLTIVDRATNHNGGSLDFGPDGYLYLSLGDEGNAEDSFNNARYITQRYETAAGGVKRTGFWGKMLRLDPDKRAGNLTPNPHQQNSTLFPSAVKTGGYLIPADNPFIGATSWHGETIAPADVRTEIYATGLRNPFRWTFDKPTGRIFLGDVGQNTWEEIDIIQKGGDYGWSWREGKHGHTPPAPTAEPASGFSPIDPIYEYDRVNDSVGSDAILTGNCVTGGAVYRGNRLTELYGAYIFADYNGGTIVALRESGSSWVAQKLGSNANIVNFASDPRNGDLLLCNLGSGTIRRLTRTATSGTAPPATLSAVGAFSNLTTLAPQPGIVAYDVNVPFWSDYAIKRRWFSIRNTTDKVTFNRDANWTLPAGMVWVKHFDLETTRGNPATAKKLETRILVKTTDGVYGLSYRWRADQTDADLVDESGLNDPIAVTVNGAATTQTWRFPSRTECMNCHTAVGGSALSFNTRQLNHDHLYGSQTLNQIAALQSAGYLSAPVANLHTLPKYAAAADATQSLEWRARSYFAVNCSQCHQPGGPANGNWDARATVALDSAQILNGAVLNNFGDAANRVIVPGDATHSVAVGRISGSLPKMPPIGSNVTDQAAIDLLTAWISQELPARQSFTQWQLAKFGNPLPANSAATADPDGDGLNNQAEYLAGTNPLAGNPSSLLKMQISGNVLNFNYSLPANRALVIESSTDLSAGSWSEWDVEGNAPSFSATGGARSLEVALPVGGKRFFRGRISMP